MRAMIFPGQGTQFIGMGGDLIRRFPAAREAFDEASDLVGRDVEELCLRSSATELEQTANAQLAIVVTSVSALRVLAAEGVAPDIVAGHSVGGIAALVAAGSLSYAAALALVCRRGELLGGCPPGGVMVSVNGLPASTVDEVVVEGSEHGVVVVGLHNARDIVVLSGEPAAVDAAAGAARRAGARRVTRLRVSHAFHSPLMSPAADAWRTAAASVPLTSPTIPVVSDTHPVPTRSAEDLQRALVGQLTGVVRWHEVMNVLDAAGVDHVIEVGASRALTALWRLDGHDAPVESAGDRRSGLLAWTSR